MNGSHEFLGGHNWWSRITATATGNTTVKTVPVATAVGLTHRLVVIGYQISGLNTNVALTTAVLRCVTTTTAVLLAWSMSATVGTVQDSGSGLWIPAIAGESLELVVGGAITGNVSLTLFGKIFPASTPLADGYTGAP